MAVRPVADGAQDAAGLDRRPFRGRRSLPPSPVEELADERPETTAVFPGRPLASYALTRSRSAESRPIMALIPPGCFPDATQELGFRHIRTRPTHHGRAGTRRAWSISRSTAGLNVRPFALDDERSQALQPFVEFCNHRLLDGGLNGLRPIDRSGDDVQVRYSWRGQCLSKSSTWRESIRVAGDGSPPNRRNSKV